MQQLLKKLIYQKHQEYLYQLRSMILHYIFSQLSRSKLNNIQMTIRRMKPSQIDTVMNKKLKSANFFNQLKQIQEDKQDKQQESIQFNIKKQKRMQQKKVYQQKNFIKTSKSQYQKKQTKNNLKEYRKNKENSNQLVQQQGRQTLSNLNKALKTLGKALEPINPKDIGKKGIDQVTKMQNKEIKQAIQDMKKLSLKDFSIMIHRLLINASGIRSTDQKYIWKQIQDNFIERFQVTTDPQKIRSYSKIIYSMAKSKVHKDNSKSLISSSISTNLQSLQTKFALLLPSATHQSFTTIITSLSRMGPLSQQFSYIVQRLYYNKYIQFNARQKIQINYALSRNGRQVDTKLITYIQQMNLKQILIMLRCYSNSGSLDHAMLGKAESHIILRKKQMNAIDIGDVCALYFSAIEKGYKISQQMELVITQMYSILKRNINEVTFEKIWQNLPNVINKGFLQINFMEEIIKTLKILHKKKLFPQRIWKPMRQSFKKFKNLQLRKRLQEIE